MKDLNQVLEFLNEIPCINQGGCGISALAVYRWLKKNNSLSDDFAIIYLHYWDNNDMELNNNFISGESKVATSCSHAIFRYNGKLYDSNGIHRGVDVSTTNHVVITVKDIERFMRASLSVSNWNTCFSREQAIPLINKKLQVDLELA